MKCLLTSDLHANYSHNTTKIHKKFWNKIKKEQPDLDAIFLAGDLGMTCLKDVEQCLKTYRETFPNMPTYVQFGNHDYWDRYTPLIQVFKALKELAHKYSCQWNESDLEVSGNIPGTIFGFDGWYHEKEPPTNDYRWLNAGWDDFELLQNRALADFHSLHLDINYSDTKSNNPRDCTDPRPWILITHFPSFPQYFNHDGSPDHSFNANPDWQDWISKTFDYCLTGHSHREADFWQGKCWFLNAGSDYNLPKYKVFEV